MRKILVFAGVFTIAACAGCSPAGAPNDVKQALASPYAADTGRTIKALSPDQIRGLLAGDGLSYALAAELNSYPGPRHVLDLADSLTLTSEQLRAVEGEFEKMRREAALAGRDLVRAERQLDSLFASGMASEADVRALTEEAARHEARVRHAHLAAHVRTTEILSADQIHLYDRMRGYGDHGGGDRHDAESREPSHDHQH